MNPRAANLLGNRVSYSAVVVQIVARLVVLLGIVVIRCYQAMIRPLLVGACKFHPSCSEYAIEALALHGPARGGYLALRRLLRCHPFGLGGLDPVPRRTSS